MKLVKEKTIFVWPAGVWKLWNVYSSVWGVPKFSISIKSFQGFIGVWLCVCIPLLFTTADRASISNYVPSVLHKRAMAAGEERLNVWFNLSFLHLRAVEHCTLFFNLRSQNIHTHERISWKSDMWLLNFPIARTALTQLIPGLESRFLLIPEYLHTNQIKVETALDFLLHVSFFLCLVLSWSLMKSPSSSFIFWF